MIRSDFVSYATVLKCPYILLEERLLHQIVEDVLLQNLISQEILHTCRHVDGEGLFMG